ncbi:MAG: serine/threonine-protein kinase [Polyangiales bacterium]
MGTTVGGCWRVDRVLGTCGTTTLYAATHASGRRAAFKILRRELAENAELHAQFLAEAELALRVSHPDRLEIQGLGVTDDGSPLLIMEPLEGETLASLSRRKGRVRVEHALALTERLLDFLDACHAAFVVHPDLKQEDLFLTIDGRVKVLDFGVARSLHRAENLRIDVRSDLQAVGAILWSILSGQMPRDVLEIVDRALERNPQHRFQSARQMRSAVVEALKNLDRPSRISTARLGARLEPVQRRER